MSPRKASAKPAAKKKRPPTKLKGKAVAAPAKKLAKKTAKKSAKKLATTAAKEPVVEAAAAKAKVPFKKRRKRSDDQPGWYPETRKTLIERLDNWDDRYSNKTLKNWAPPLDVGFAVNRISPPLPWNSSTAFHLRRFPVASTV